MEMTTRTVVLAAADGAVGFCWYAMPDVLRSRPARTVAKTVLLGASLATHLVLDPQRSTRRLDGLKEARGSVPLPVMLAAGTGLLALSTAAAVRRERKIFARAEQRRAEGVRLAHTRRAVRAGLLLGLRSLLPDTDYSTARTDGAGPAA